MNREICGHCGQSLDPNWIDERIPKLEAMMREAIRERDSLRQHLHEEHQRHVVTMDECDALQSDLAAARALLKQANEMLAEAIVCGPKLREYMPLRQRIVAALAGKDAT